jgi:hypothetical protein
LSSSLGGFNTCKNVVELVSSLLAFVGLLRDLIPTQNPIEQVPSPESKNPFGDKLSVLQHFKPSPKGSVLSMLQH